MIGDRGRKLLLSIFVATRHVGVIFDLEVCDVVS
jgi:hypothetical protein